MGKIAFERLYGEGIKRPDALRIRAESLRHTADRFRHAPSCYSANGVVVGDLIEMVADLTEQVADLRAEIAKRTDDGR